MVNKCTCLSAGLLRCRHNRPERSIEQNGTAEWTISLVKTAEKWHVGWDTSVTSEKSGMSA